MGEPSRERTGRVGAFPIDFRIDGEGSEPSGSILESTAKDHLIRTYGEVRRMLTYVRWWEEDAEAIAPSLWSGRRRGRSESEEDVFVDPVAVEPSPSNGGPVQPGPTNGGPFVG